METLKSTPTKRWQTLLTVGLVAVGALGSMIALMSASGEASKDMAATWQAGALRYGYGFYLVELGATLTDYGDNSDARSTRT